MRYILRYPNFFLLLLDTFSSLLMVGMKTLEVTEVLDTPEASGFIPSGH
ncbi:hypothetical protein [Ulvibacter antarcticus]|nr:hypothetical protein [Ulvibacter antarcticus]